jgi:hypothetical protein
MIGIARQFNCFNRADLCNREHHTTLENSDHHNPDAPTTESQSADPAEDDLEQARRLA